MVIRTKIIGYFFMLVLCVSLFAACKKDEVSSMLSVNATLSGANEVPAVTTTGTGTLTGTYDKETKLMTCIVNWKVDGTILTGMHFHGPASTTESAGVVIGFSGFSTSPSGTFTTTTRALTAAEEADLLAGKWYINVHSDKARGGEIRGQLSVK
ncbi:MAG: CHRD domain-containing protein [Cytophagales bacterium]|nr:MAG: CHRD domain-containing protein [Cytophagales bacterium]